MIALVARTPLIAAVLRWSYCECVTRIRSALGTLAGAIALVGSTKIVLPCQFKTRVACPTGRMMTSPLVVAKMIPREDVGIRELFCAVITRCQEGGGGIGILNRGAGDRRPQLEPATRQGPVAE